ncbi:MAG: hypothetical protein AAF754_00650 [Pseudomonadota bacterium]
MSKIRHHSHELPGSTVSGPRYGLAVFSPDDRLLHMDAAWQAIFANVRDASSGITLGKLAELAVGQGVVDPGYLSNDDWCGTLLTWWKHGAKTPFQIDLRSGCAVHLACSHLGEEGRIAVAIEMVEGDHQTSTGRRPSFDADKIYALMTSIGAATHGLSSSNLSVEQAAWLDAICDAGEGVVELLGFDPTTSDHEGLRQAG